VQQLEFTLGLVSVTGSFLLQEPPEQQADFSLGFVSTTMTGVVSLEQDSLVQQEDFSFGLGSAVGFALLQVDLVQQPDVLVSVEG
jgi:hypothetical protein